MLDKYLYYACLSSKKIYKIKMKTLLKCPNKEQANNHSILANQLSSQPGGIASMGRILLCGDTTGFSILGTDVGLKHNRNTVRYKNAIILYVVYLNNLLLITIYYCNQ